MLKLGLLFLVLPGLILMTVFWNELSTVNACLSSGGSFDYLNQICDRQNSHPFIPFSARKPLFVNLTMLASGLGFLFCLFALYVRAR